MTELLKAMEINEVELEQTVGGNDGLSNKAIVVGRTYTTHVATGYLALRTQPTYNPGNEIGPLCNGSKVTVVKYTKGARYAWVTVKVAAPGAYFKKGVAGKSGYVDVRYLQ